MTSTGRDLLGTNLYDILSPSKPQVMTIGNTSNDAYITIYSCNLPNQKGYNFGLCNDTFVIVDNSQTTRVGINTIRARNTLDVVGTVALQGLTSYTACNLINVNQSSFSNVKDVYFTGTTYYNGVALSSSWVTASNNTGAYSLANIGIGTTLPKYSLDVVGDLNFTNTLYKNGTEFRESQFRFLPASGSNIYYGGSVGVGATTTSSNELVNYRMFVNGDVAIDGKLYANDFIIYKGENPGKYKEVDIYGINPYGENKTIVTNSTSSASNVLYEFKLKASQYMTFVNLPYKNLSGTTTVNGKNWFEIVLVGGAASNYNYNSEFISKIPIEVRSSGNNTDIDNVEFFIEAPVEQNYVLAVRGFGHTIEFGGVALDQYNSPYVKYNSRLRIIPIKNIGDDSSYSVRKALQITPIRQQYILAANASNFNFTTEGNYEAAASNVDVFINGLKYVYYNSTKKDYDISYSYNYDTNLTTFSLQLAEAAQKDDVLDIAIWPYATADTLYASGYYYQQINHYPTQWLNVASGLGVRYPKSVVVDGDLIVRGNIVGGCNTDIFYAGLPTGDLAFTCNVVGTTNIIDGAITHSKIAMNAIRNYNIADNTIQPSKFDFKNKVVVIGCNSDEVVISPSELPRNRGLYIDGDVFIKGGVQACNFAGSTESIADLSVTTLKLAPNAVTFEKLAGYSVSNINIANNVISTRHLQPYVVATSNLALNSVTSQQLALNTIQRSNLAARIITSNEIDHYSITVGQLNLVSGNVGIGTLLGSNKLHVEGDSLLKGHLLCGSNAVFDIATSNAAYRRGYFSDFISIADYQLRRVNNRFEVARSDGSIVNLHTGNIGIGTTVNLDRVDILSGGMLIRSGQLGIGTTSARATIDALNTANSTLLINKLGVGTTAAVDTCSIFGGGLLISDSQMAVTSGNLGIGTTLPTSKLQVVNGTTTISNPNGIAINSTGSNLFAGPIISCNIAPFALGQEIGTATTPYAKIYTGTVEMGAASVSYSNNRVIINKPLEITSAINYENFYPYRNLVINGDMRVNQRYPGSNHTLTNNTPIMERYTLDRHESFVSNVSTQFVVSQSNLSRDYLHTCRVGVTTSSITNDSIHMLFGHKIESSLTNSLYWGTNSALPISISFDLLSTVNATYYLGIHNADKTRSLIRTVPVTASSETSRYTFVIPGDTGGYWESDIGINIGLYTGVGSSYLTGTTNTWQAGAYFASSDQNDFTAVSDAIVAITNVQVEAGELSTVFEKRPLVVELGLCQRYYEKSYNLNTVPASSTAKGCHLIYCATSDGGSTNWVAGNIPFKIVKRNDIWTGTYYSISGTPSVLSYRDANSGQFSDYTESPTPSASNTVFGLVSESGYAYNFQLNAQTSRTYAYQWTVDNEL